MCKNLKHVTLAEDSRLERIGEWCFCDTRIETLAFPSTLREIEIHAFDSCEYLKSVTFAPGSRLEKVGRNCFYGAGIERVIISKGVEEI